MNKNFFDQLDGDWAEVLTNTYEAHNDKYCKIIHNFENPLTYVSDKGEKIENINKVTIFFETITIPHEVNLKDRSIFVYIKADMDFYILSNDKQDYNINVADEDKNFNIEYYFTDAFGTSLSYYRSVFERNFDYNLNKSNGMQINKKLNTLISNYIDDEIINSYNQNNRAVNKIVHAAKQDLKNLIVED